jgi:hypothetical protein
MADWVTISSLATAGGTLVLATATFSSVRSANRSARVAERSLLAAQRPVLIPSREDDPPERIMFVEGHWVTVEGHGAVVELLDGRIYLAMGVRNGGAGLAVIHGWRAVPHELGTPMPQERPDLEEFRRQTRDLYIPVGASGFWQGAMRDPSDPSHAALAAAARDGALVLIDLLYGDQEGGQRAIARFSVTVNEDGGGRSANSARFWNIDREDPR